MNTSEGEDRNQLIAYKKKRLKAARYFVRFISAGAILLFILLLPYAALLGMRVGTGILMLYCIVPIIFFVFMLFFSEINERFSLLLAALYLAVIISLPLAYLILHFCVFK